MYKLIKLNNDASDWNEIRTFNSIDEVRSNIHSMPDDPTSIIVYDGELPTEVEAQNNLIKQVMDLNNGRIVRVTIGATITPETKGIASSCSGNCFCVVEGGSRRCETYYCNDWWCWWVPCGSGC